jgi:serine/threonine-protein kinase
VSFCGFCGTKLPTGARFCGECGRGVDEPFIEPLTSPAATSVAVESVVAATAPATPTAEPVAIQPRGRSGPLVVVGLLGLVAVAAGVFLLTRSDDSSSEGAATTIAGTSTATGDTTTTSSTTPIDPTQAASDQLQLLITQDRPTADTLVGNWVVQLSAKRVGLQADGIVYGPIEIAADHTTLRNTYGAILIDAGAFQFQSDGSPMIGWYLTMVPEIFGASADAARWCADRSLAANVCLARLFPQPNA